MKPYGDLTYLGRVRRMRQLALVSLEAYGLAGARFKFVLQAGNTLFRVYDPSPDQPSRTMDFLQRASTCCASTTRPTKPPTPSNWS